MSTYICVRSMHDKPGCAFTDLDNTTERPAEGTFSKLSQVRSWLLRDMQPREVKGPLYSFML